MRGLALAALVGVWILSGCSNVAQMQQKYLAGDESQFYKLAEIVARGDYPYATRKNAARVLGELGEPRALPALVTALNEYDQRTTLKEAALVALGQIGDPAAVEPIGRLLDRSLADPSAELRLAAIPVLGRLGGEQAANILVNAIGYYDIVMLQQEQRVPRGVFTGEEQQFPFGPDSTGQRPPRGLEPGGGFFGESRTPQTSMFGTEMNFGGLERYNSIPDERALTHAALVEIGEVAITPISDYLNTNRTTPTLRKELLEIVEEIRQAQSPASQTREPGLDAVDKD